MTWQRFEIAVEQLPGETRDQTEGRLDYALWKAGNPFLGPADPVTHIQFPVPEDRQVVSEEEAERA
jgi:hypothetical protein